MNVIETVIPDIMIIDPEIFEDSRGFFMETFHEQKFSDRGLPVRFAQDNHSYSVKGTLRGLHYQLKYPQGKLVRVVRGEVYDVAVDIRVGSPYFGRWVGEILSEQNRRQIYIPPGFAHGFCVLSDCADFLYKCTEIYEPQDDYGILWNDPDIGITWPELDYIISKKDQRHLCLEDLKSKLPQYKKA